MDQKGTKKRTNKGTETGTKKGTKTGAKKGTNGDQRVDQKVDQKAAQKAAQKVDQKAAKKQACDTVSKFQGGNGRPRGPLSGVFQPRFGALFVALFGPRKRSFGPRDDGILVHLPALVSRLSPAGLPCLPRLFRTEGKGPVENCAWRSALEIG